MKTKVKRWIGILFSVGIVICLMSAHALADGDVARVGEDGYSKLADAIDVVSPGGTITLLQNTTITTPLRMNKSYTLDFNNCTVYYNTTATTTISGASTIVFTNGTLDISGAQMLGTSPGNDIFSFNDDGNKLTFDKMKLFGEGYSGYSVFWFKGSNTTPVNTLNFENGSIIERLLTCTVL